MDRFEVILKETIAYKEHPRYFIVNSNEKGMTSEIWLTEELFLSESL